jgi:predicted metal-dependent hydrolase
VVLHEIAHLETLEHDHRFIDRLQHLAGKTARLLAEGGPELAAKLRAGDPDGGR